MLVRYFVVAYPVSFLDELEESVSVELGHQYVLDKVGEPRSLYLLVDDVIRLAVTAELDRDERHSVLSLVDESGEVQVHHRRLVHIVETCPVVAVDCGGAVVRLHKLVYVEMEDFRRLEYDVQLPSLFGQIACLCNAALIDAALLVIFCFACHMELFKWYLNGVYR